MKRNDQCEIQVSPPKGFPSVKIISIILVGFLIVGTIPTTHSYPSAKAGFNNFWLAAKELWDSLLFFSFEQEKLEKQSSNDFDNRIVWIDEKRIEKLKTHPQCRSVYVSEYLPTFNTQAVEKCERIIERYEQNQLFTAYVQQLCQNPGSSALNRQQVAEIQLRLRKYALMFPQSEIEIAATDIDGLYGSKTCEMIANYQIISKFDMVDGSANVTVYNDLTAAIHLSEQELASLEWQPTPQVTKSVVDQIKKENTQQPKPSFELPANPLKRIAFCMRNSHIQKCEYSNQQADVAQAEINSK